MITSAPARRLALFLYLATSLAGTASASRKPPFTLTWIDGRCPTCDRAWDLNRIRFTTRTDGWATGESWPPPGAQGAEDDALLHTSDGGRTWRELRDARSHAVPPAFCFITPLHGWVSRFAYSVTDQDWLGGLFVTDDGGRTWNKVFPSQFRRLEFLDSLTGFAVSPAKGADTLMRTRDGGRSWSALPLQGEYFNQVLFLDAKLGWVAGFEGHQPVVVRTRDGGQTWSCSKVPDPATANVRDLYFADPMNGWVVTWHFDEEGTRLFRTSDGGETWVPDTDQSFQGPHHWLSVVRQVARNATFAFYAEDTTPVEPTASGTFAAWAGRLLFSPDGGHRWAKFDLPHPVLDCQVLAGDLVCSAGSFHVLLVHPEALK